MLYGRQIPTSYFLSLLSLIAKTTELNKTAIASTSTSKQIHAPYEEHAIELNLRLQLAISSSFKKEFLRCCY